MRPTHFDSPAALAAWLQTGPPSHQAMRLTQPRYGNHGDAVAEHYPLDRLPDADLLRLCQNPTTTALVCLNPTLTEAQLAMLAASAVPEPGVDGHRPAVELEVLRRFALRAGRAFPDAPVLAALRAALRSRAERVQRHDGRDSTLGMCYATFGLFAVYSHALTTEDLDWALAANPRRESTAEQVVRHPAAPRELVVELLEAHDYENGIVAAAAHHPLAMTDAAFRDSILEAGVPWASAIVAPALRPAELAQVVEHLALVHPRRALTFLEHLEPEDLARLTPEALAPVLASGDADVRVKAQLLVAGVGLAAAATAGEPTTGPAPTALDPHAAAPSDHRPGGVRPPGPARAR